MEKQVCIIGTYKGIVKRCYVSTADDNNRDYIIQLEETKMTHWFKTNVDPNAIVDFTIENVF